MRISDWSADVCSSDLGRGAHAQQRIARAGKLDLLGAILGDQQQAAVGSRLGDDAKMGAVAKTALLRARLRQAEPVDRWGERRVGNEWGRTCRYRGSTER